MSSFTDVNDLLESGGVTPAKFETIGASATGKIVHAEVQQQREIDTGKPKFWDDGKPRMQIVVHLQTTQRDPAVSDDDGKRAVYCRGNMLKALRSALRTAGAQLEVGGTLAVTYTGDGEAKRGFNAPKLYTVTYTPSAVSGMAAVNDALGAQPAAPAAPPAPVRPPSVPAAVWDTLTAEQQAALLAVTPAF